MRGEAEASQHTDWLKEGELLGRADQNLLPLPERSVLCSGMHTQLRFSQLICVHKWLRKRLSLPPEDW